MQGVRLPGHAPRRRRAAPAHRAPRLHRRPHGHLRRLGRRPRRAPPAAPGDGRCGGLGGGKFKAEKQRRRQAEEVPLRDVRRQLLAEGSFGE